MGRHVRQLGGLSGADMSISPDGRNFTWFTSDLPDPIQVYVECSDETRERKPFVGGRGGVQTISWIIPGRVCTFTLDAAGKTILSLVVDSRQGFPVKTSIIRAGAPAAPTAAPITAAPPAVPGAPANGTIIPGIPDLYLYAGGGILAIAMLAKKRR